MEHVLDVRDLEVRFFSYYGVVRAVNGLSYQVGSCETVGIVGESGSGKSVSAMAAMGLVERPGYVTAGAIHFEGRDLLAVSEKEWQLIRGNDITMCFQNPMRALNPLMKIGHQLTRVYMTHKHAKQGEARRRAVQLLREVNIADADRTIDRYPHQLSGGMCQRVMTVMALMCEPKVLILDEPTTGLDVTVQKQLLHLLRELRDRATASQVLITHDLGVVANICDCVVVMYAGRVMEQALVGQLFSEPKHPYTRALLQAIPQIEAKKTLHPIPGDVPEALNLPVGCPFHPRCTHRMDTCERHVPELRLAGDRQQVACHLYGEEQDE
ncbi:ABC transporter ATP-binding protein [Candidatus Bipolaricaulota bacterium]